MEIQDNKIISGEKSYAIEKRLVNILDKVIDRITQDNPKLDAVLINEGSEGEGKSSCSVLEAAYCKIKTGKDIHLFFNLEPMMEFAKKTEGQIIIWDEPALDSLSTDQVSALNKNMLRLFMTIRKKRHLFFINYTKFWKFPEYMVVDRANGMVHLYSSKGRHGKFCYIKKKKLEHLWNDHQRSKLRSYNKHKSFRGEFPNFMDFEFDNLGVYVNEIPNATMKIYESEKDKATNAIGEKKSKKFLQIEQEWRSLKGRIARLDYKNLKTQADLAKGLGINRLTLNEWSKFD